MATKKKRTKKTSQGIHGATKVRLSEIQKILLGKGKLASMKPLGQK